MIKNALKIFFGNLIYLFIAMGIIYLFIILAIFGFAAAALTGVQTMLDDAFALVQSAAESSGNSLREFFNYATAQLDTSGNIFEIIARIIDTNWLQTTIQGFFETLNLSVEGFNSDLNAIISEFFATLQASFAAAVTLIVIGIIFAAYATRFVLRRKNAKRNVRKYLIAKFCEPLLHACILVLALFILSALSAYAILVYIGLAATLAVVALTSSWLIHRDGSLKFKEVVNPKNVGLYFLSMLIIFAINLAVAVALFFLNPLLAVLVAVPLAVYSLGTAGVSTDSFVLEMNNPAR